MTSLFRIPVLSHRRIWLGFIVAVAADAAQFLMGPAGWMLFDELIDVAAMCLLTFLVGFHPLFLPTFVVEFLPVADLLPTWTGCITVVVATRRKRQRNESARPVPPPPGTIDI